MPVKDKYFDKEEAMRYWIKSSDQDFKTMKNLFRTKDYSWALFIGHLVIEKLLKACYVSSKQKHSPMIHNLLKLADSAGIELSPDKKETLDIITAFNLSARYDSYKQEFHKRCTRSFAEQWIAEIKSFAKMDKKKAISIAKQFVNNLPVEYKVRRAFLFGSFAKGNAHKDSDVDVALILPGRFNTFDMRIKLMRIRRDMDVAIEPHPIPENEFNNSNPLASEILKYGIPLM